MTAARTKKTIIPPKPPTKYPIPTSKTVSAVSNTVVLRVFIKIHFIAHILITVIYWFLFAQ